MKFGEKLKGFEPYEPFKYNGQIRLDANESYTDIPIEIKKQIADKLMNIEFNRYPDPNAVELCSTFGDYYGINSKNIVAGNGSDELISIIIGFVLSKGNRAMVTSPDFSMYRIYFETAEIKCDVYDKNIYDFSFDKGEITEFINKNEIDFFVFSNPCNPTGQMIKTDEVEYILKNTSCMICVDEAYMDFSDSSVLYLIKEYDNLLVLKTLSKNIGLAALRIGFAISNEKNINYIRAAKSPYNVNTLSQQAATVVLKNKDYLNKVTKELIAKRKNLELGLREFENDNFYICNSDTNFIYIKTDSADQIYNKLLDNNIVVRCFNGKALRISTGNDQENKALINALRRILK